MTEAMIFKDSNIFYHVALEVCTSCDLDIKNSNLLSMDNFCTTVGNPHANYGQKAPIQYYEHQILIKGHTAWCRPRYTCPTKRHNGAVPRIRSHKSRSVPLRHSK